MLSQLDTNDVVEINYNSVAPATPRILEFPINSPYELVSIRWGITAQAAIVIPGLGFFDPAGNLVGNFAGIPWLFAGTTIENTTGQTPDPSIVTFFTNNIGGFIYSGFHAYPGWSMLWGDVLGTPGVIFNGTITFVRSDYHNE